MIDYEQQSLWCPFISSSSIDYHTQRRISQLHHRLDEIQRSNFLKFINYHLTLSHCEEKRVTDLIEDLSNGHVFLDLLELFTSKKFAREFGRTRFHALSNVEQVLNYLKLHIHHLNISPHEIVSGNRKQILALLWMIMKLFDFPSFRLTSNKHVFSEQTLLTCGYDRSFLWKWLNFLLNSIHHTDQVIYVKDFLFRTWMENDHLMIIVKCLSPLSENASSWKYFDYLQQLNRLDRTTRAYWQVFWNFSTFLFQTNNVQIDPTDRTEKHLLKYFSELYQSIYNLFQGNSLEKLHGNNLYTKALVETLAKTIYTDSWRKTPDEEEYLIYTENKVETIEEKEELIIPEETSLPPSIDSMDNPPVPANSSWLRIRLLLLLLLFSVCFCLILIIVMKTVGIF